MDNETLNALATIAEKITSTGLLLYFVMYFKVQAERNAQARIDHLENDISISRDKFSETKNHD